MALEIRSFETKDGAQAEALFITVNRAIAPPDMADRFETYISASIAEEIGRIKACYTAKNGQFWVAYEGNAQVANNKTIGGGIRRRYYSKGL